MNAPVIAPLFHIRRLSSFCVGRSDKVTTTHYKSRVQGICPHTPIMSMVWLGIEDLQQAIKLSVLWSEYQISGLLGIPGKINNNNQPRARLLLIISLTYITRSGECISLHQTVITAKISSTAFHLLILGVLLLSLPSFLLVF